jgi:hypothetical protein
MNWSQTALFHPPLLLHLPQHLQFEGKIMMVFEWKTKYCEYAFEDPADQNGNVFVTTLHWTCRARDDGARDASEDGSNSVSACGTVDAKDQNRVYTLAALRNVPESVMTEWVKQALDNAPEAEETSVADIEERLTARWNELQQPSTGGITPGETS